MSLVVIAGAAGLVWWGWFVLGFLEEPSAVDRGPWSGHVDRFPAESKVAQNLS